MLGQARVVLSLFCGISFARLLLYQVMLLLHILGASVWIGGHFVLGLSVLPRALKAKDVPTLHRFEVVFEPVGVPALLLQIVTGVWLAYNKGLTFTTWFQWDSSPARLVGMKMLLLFLTVIVGVSARLIVVPRLTGDTLWVLGLHIYTIMLLALGFAVVGIAILTGWF